MIRDKNQQLQNPKLTCLTLAWDFLFIFTPSLPLDSLRQDMDKVNIVKFGFAKIS